MLIQEQYLNEIYKEAYIDLLSNVKSGMIKPDFYNKLNSALEFDPSPLFPYSYRSSCYDYIIDQLKLVDDDDWQYIIRDGFWRSEAGAFLHGDITLLIESINTIPKDKFEMIMYR